MRTMEWIRGGELGMRKMKSGKAEMDGKGVWEMEHNRIRDIE